VPILKSLPKRSPDLARVRANFDGERQKADLPVHRLPATWHTIGSKTGQPLPPCTPRVTRDRAPNFGIARRTTRPSGCETIRQVHQVGLRRPARGLAHYSLDLEELVECEVATLASVAAHLVAAERRRGIAGAVN
jgi:hypothetical protein